MPPSNDTGRCGVVRHVFFRWLADRSGAVALYIALALPMFVGAAGLAVDVASWYSAKRTIQSAADAAAYAAALSLARQGLAARPDFRAIRDFADDAAGRNGVRTPVTVNIPPSAGIAVGDPQAVEVIVSDAAPLHFTNLFFGTAPQITARAVAKAVVSDPCVWSLHPTAPGALTVAGNADVNLRCGVLVNSQHPEAALNQTGSSCLSATSVGVRGRYKGRCVSPEPEILVPDYGNPLSGLLPPDYHGTCDFPHKVTIDGDASSLPVHLDPGVYCGGLELNGRDIVFRPGLYVLDGGKFRISGNASVGNDENAMGGVTFYLTGNGGDYAYLEFEPGADIELTPMSAGALANVLFFQDPDAPAGGSNRIAGGVTMSLTGIIYVPSQHVRFSGGSRTDEAEIVLVADTITFTGTTYLDAGYASSVLPEHQAVRFVD